MKKHFSAGGVLVNNKHEVYLLHQIVRDEWVLPKGGIEEGEDKITAAKREIQEETGYQNTEIILQKPLYTHQYSFTHPNTGEEIEKTVTFYLFKLLDDNLEATKEMSAEHLEGKWFTLEEAMQKVTFDDLRTVLEKVQEHLSSTTQP